MRIRSIPKQLVLLAIAAFAITSVASGTCPETIQPAFSGRCIKDTGLPINRYGFVTRLRLTDLWQLDAGGIHPPLRLPQLEIEQLIMESLWGLRPGESLIGDPRWGVAKRQPDLDAIVFLHAREAAMSSRMIENH